MTTRLYLDPQLPTFGKELSGIWELWLASLTWEKNEEFISSVKIILWCCDIWVAIASPLSLAGWQEWHDCHVRAFLMMLFLSKSFHKRSCKMFMVASEVNVNALVFPDWSQYGYMKYCYGETHSTIKCKKIDWNGWRHWVGRMKYFTFFQSKKIVKHTSVTWKISHNGQFWLEIGDEAIVTCLKVCRCLSLF